jgi:hypothetical protein
MTARRQAEDSPPVWRTPLPEWMKSCRHLTTLVQDGAERRAPYDGVFHARQIGAAQTACGTPALYWVNLYDQAYQPGAPDACEACDPVVLAARAVPR